MTAAVTRGSTGRPASRWKPDGTPTAGGRALARSIAAGMIPDVTIEYTGYHGDLRPDPSFPASSGQIASYVEGFITSARAIHEKYPGAIFEPMNEPWAYTTPRDDGAQYADVIARLLPAAAAAGVPLQQIYVAAYGPDASASAEQIGGWVPAMYEAQPQLQREIAGWYFHPYGPPEGNEFEPGIRSVPEVQRLMTSGQNNIIVSEIGFCALDVSRAPDCLGHAEAPDSTPRSGAADQDARHRAVLPRRGLAEGAHRLRPRRRRLVDADSFEEGSPRRVKHSMRSQISTPRHGRACPRPTLSGAEHLGF